MATKTLILRPESIITDSLDEETMSNVAFYPSSFDFSNGYKLVNEEIADDDSTYISISPGGKIVFKLTGTKPSDFKEVVAELGNLKVYLNIKSEVSDASAFCGASISFSSWSGPAIGLKSTSDNTYSVISSQFALTEDSSDNNPFNIYFNNNSIWDINLSVTANTGSKANPFRISQVWLELIYESYDLETIYFKNNNNWVSASGRIYEKKNGVWSISDSSLLNSGKHYIINNQIE